MIKVENLNYIIKDKKILKNVSFDIPKNSVTLLIGPNGAGKTTTLELIAGIRKNNNESLQLINKNYKVLLLDSSYLIFDELTAHEFLSFISELNNVSINYLNDVIKEFRKINVHSFLGTRLKHLSKGEKQKLVFMTAFLSNADILLFDEPFNGLDIYSLKIIKEMLNIYKNKYTFVIATHDVHDFSTYVDSCIILKEGEVKKQLFKSKEGDIFECKYDN
ncbi:MAG: ABC transporter ATP-binding protein [Brockia lithotrophica]|nr:ABC transporter ATP-binding protein [Brockia lithotrophica]